MKKTILAAAVLVASGSAFAEGMADKFYVEAGWSQLEADFSSVWTNVDDSDDTYRLTLGFDVNENFSVEGGVIGSTEVSATLPTGSYTVEGISGTVTANSNPTAVAEADEMFMLGGKFSLPVNADFSLYAKAGLIWWDVDYRLTSGSITHSGTTYTSLWYSDDGSDPYFGVGAAYEFSDNLGVRADWLRTEIDDDDIDMLTASLAYKF
jgi:OOP family OmpA-OmpF porin